MLDKKLTDNEIIKALECCINSNCGECPMIDTDNCDLDKLTLDLINRQKAEIERLKATVDSFTDIGKLYSEIKAEAYKECIEKVKTEAENATCVYEPDRPQADNMVYHISNIRLNNLLKELVGEDK